MPTENQEKEVPLYIKVNAKDNVAIIVNAGGLPKGTVFSCGLELEEYIPEGHKVALTDLAQDQPIIRYGEVIGYATQTIKKGSWIEESLVMMPTPPKLEELTLATERMNKRPISSSALEDNTSEWHMPEGYTFAGYRNRDGSVGIRNILGITTSVQCVAGVLDYAVQRIKKEILPRYPKVDNVVALNHNYGCGVAINVPEAVIPIRTLKNIATHPNFGGEIMVVSLGCEKLLPQKLTPDGGSENILILQEQQGFGKMVQAIMEMAEKCLRKLNSRERVSCPVADLVVGLQCGGSDAFSGVTANPAVGYAADLLVRAGATVLFSEVTEVRDAVHLLTPRALRDEVRQALIREMKWYDDYLQRGEADRSANPSPGNKKGGLANVVEKALGSIAKSGSSPITGVLSHGEKATHKGLIFAATPASDFICGTLQLAAGMNLQVFTTGRGTPYGLAMAPVIKVATRTSLMEQWPDLIDVDAGRIATGEASIAEVGWEIFHLILEIASGRKQPWAEQWGLANDLALFNPAPVT